MMTAPEFSPQKKTFFSLKNVFFRSMLHCGGFVEISTLYSIKFPFTISLSDAYTHIRKQTDTQIDTLVVIHLNTHNIHWHRFKNTHKQKCEGTSHTNKGKPSYRLTVGLSVDNFSSLFPFFLLSFFLSFFLLSFFLSFFLLSFFLSCTLWNFFS